MLKIMIVKFFKRMGYKVQKIEDAPFIAEADGYDLETIRLARQISMQSHERLWALINATKYIALNNIPGAFVECGVYKGGSAVVIARTLNRYKILDRKIYLYDTYEGMTAAQEIDKKITIVGSLEPIGSKTATAKTFHGISNDTWVCHAYYTHEGKALAFPVPVFKTFSEMMAAVEVILTSL